MELREIREKLYYLSICVKEGQSLSKWLVNVTASWIWGQKKVLVIHNGVSLKLMTLRPTLFGPEATKSSLYVVARDRHGNGKLSLCIQMNDCGKIIKTKFLYRDEESCQEQQCSICVHEENAEPQCLSKVPCVRAKNAEPQCLSRSVPCVMMMIPHTPEGASVCVGVCVSYPTVFDPCGLIQRTPLAFQGGNLPVLESRMCVCVRMH